MSQRPVYIGKHFGRNNRSNTFRAPPAFVAANPFPRTHYTEGLREPYSSIYYPSSNPYPQINPYAYRQNPVNKTRKLRKPPPIPTQTPPIQLPPAPTRPAPPPPTEILTPPPVISSAVFSPVVVPPINPIQTTLPENNQPSQLRVVRKIQNPTPTSVVTPPPSVVTPSQGTPAQANNRPGISGQLTPRQNVSKQTLNNVRAARQRALAALQANPLKAAELEKSRLAAAERQRKIK